MINKKAISWPAYEKQYLFINSLHLFFMDINGIPISFDNIC